MPPFFDAQAWRKGRAGDLLAIFLAPTANKPMSTPRISVVIPLHNEERLIPTLLARTVAALTEVTGEFEIVCVDDGSRDGTAAELAATKQRCAQLRTVTHVVPGGQSAALWTGVRAARAQAIVTLDGDGQNNPAFLPALLDALAPDDVGLEIGRASCRERV